MGLLSGKRPAHLGVREGRLAPCPKSPNCVSSQAEDEAHRVAPLLIDPRETAGEAWQKLGRALREMPRVAVVVQTEAYLHAECASRGLGFVDDLECLLDLAAGVIHLRSASRLGYADFGQNRRRIETLRRRLAPEPT
ncbi:MAG: DUF1499 domain-containing protein [Desulfosarcinaceae bacterium]|nr:DUF1499 domain-containing protein [Desulfosarcinaceae bacterium]